MNKKKLWFVAVLAILIAIPFVLNAIIRLPKFTEIVGDETDWLSFHGSYIGAVVGATGPNIKSNFSKHLSNSLFINALTFIAFR